MMILNHLPKLQTHIFLPLKPKSSKPHLTPSLLKLTHFPIFSLFSSLSPNIPTQYPNSPTSFNDDEFEEEPTIDVSLDKLFVPPETDISSLKAVSSLKSLASSVRILKGSNIVLSKYANNAQVINAEFVKSSVKTEDCPVDGLPEFALVGRSNVGKSSLLNSLVRRKKLALTSKKPGKTQCINHFRINDNWYLVDLPGYGGRVCSNCNLSRIMNPFYVSLCTSPSLQQMDHKLLKNPTPTPKHVSSAFVDYDGNWVVPETPQESPRSRPRRVCTTSARKKLRFTELNEVEEVTIPKPNPKVELTPTTSVGSDWSPGFDWSQPPTPPMSDISPGTYDYLSMKLIKYHTP